MTDPGGYRGGKNYLPAGVVHKGEYVVPLPFDYPNWWNRIRRFVWPRKMRVAIDRRVRVYNPDKYLMKKITGKEYPHDLA